MIWIDIVILALVGFSTLISLIRGFVVEAMSIIIWITAIWAAFQFTSPLAAHLHGIDVPSVRLGVAALLLIIGILVVGSLLSWLIGRLVRSTGLSGTDRMLGAIFGFLRGSFTVLALVAVGSWTPLCADPWWRQSQLIPRFETLAIAGKAFLSSPLREMIGACRAGSPAVPESET